MEDTEKQRELRKEILKRELLIKQFNEKHFKYADQTSFQEAQKLVQTAPYNTMDLLEPKEINFTPTEEREITEEFKRTLANMLQIIKKDRVEEKLIESQKMNEEIEHMVNKKCENITKISELHTEFCKNLKMSAELKDVDDATDFDLLHSKANFNQIKSEALGSIITKTFLESNENTPQAVKEAEGFLNEALNKE